MTETTSLAQALAILQTKLPKVEKSQTAEVKTDKAKYSYSYADLAQITRVLMPILGDLGLSFIAKPTVTDDGRVVLAYKLLHVCGDAEEGRYPLPSSGTPQAMGSAITYARRYCLCAVTGVAPEDDDDGAAAEAAARAPVEPQTDPAWLEQMERSLTGATSLQALNEVADRIRAADDAGKVAYVHGQHLLHVYHQRKAELEGSPE